MMPRRKFFSCLALGMMLLLMAVARSDDPPKCDGTEAYRHEGPVPAKACANCALPCTQSECYETIGNPQSAPFGCRTVHPPPKDFTTMCVAWTWNPPPPVGPPTPIEVDCVDVKSCEPDVDGCRPNPMGQYTMKARIYTTLNDPECTKTKNDREEKGEP
jgi:hypothetical protein